MGIKETILVVLYLTSIVSARTHEPQVYEDLPEDMPEIVRRVRHSDNAQNVYQPPVFNYQTAKQQDRMLSRYHRQQQVDFQHLNIKPINPDEFFELNQRLSQNREAAVNIPFKESIVSDWKPFQPNYIAASKVKRPLEIVGKNRFPEIKQGRNTVEVFEAFENDLDSAGSENIDETIERQVEKKAEEAEVDAEEETEEKSEKKAEEKVDRGDENVRYTRVYVQPNILKNNFGMEPNAVQEMLRNAAEGQEFQISKLQGLLGKNPEYQLQGLQKLLEDTKPVMANIAQNHLLPQEETNGVEIKPNSLPILASNQPPIEDLQERLDAVNKAHADAALAAAQQQSEAHVRAQHQAIALAQKRAEEEALAKIEAHNQGRAIINPNDHLQIPVTPLPLVAESPRPERTRVEAIVHQIEQNSVESQPEKEAEESEAVENVEVSERQALNARPYEQVLLNPVYGNPRGYAPSYRDLRNNKPIINIPAGRIPQPTPFAKIHHGSSLPQPLSAVPQVYAPLENQNYAPVIPTFKPHNVQVPVETINHLPVQETQSAYEPAPTAPTLQEHRQESYQEVNIDTPSHPAKNQQQYDDLHEYAAKYAFGYRILDEKHGNDYGHEEERDGKLTKGHYFVLLPDGRRQKVEYFVDNGGYHAKVSYENVARHQNYLTPHPQEHVERREESEQTVHE